MQQAANAALCKDVYVATLDLQPAHIIAAGQSECLVKTQECVTPGVSLAVPMLCRPVLQAGCVAAGCSH